MKQPSKPAPAPTPRLSPREHREEQRKAFNERLDAEKRRRKT